MKLAFLLKLVFFNFSFPVLFPFLTPIYERLNISVFPKDSIAFFKKFVDKMKEKRLHSNQKVKQKGGGLMRGPGFDNVLGCENVSCVFPFIYNLKVDREG